ncbi:MAG: transposase [Aureliella sp.]
MAQNPRFQALDLEAEIQYSARNLPHWFQPGVATFVTFRTADSMPQAALKRWAEQQQLFLKTHNVHARNERLALAQMRSPLREQFKRFRISSFHKLLDKAYGERLLRRREVAQIVAEKLWAFDGVRYDLDSFVIMPNHVHVLVAIRKGWELRSECDNWLHYSALLINELLGRSGSFWQDEPFDHCVRSLEQFEWTRRYIWRNPRVARLARGQYFYWQSPNRADQ